MKLRSLLLLRSLGTRKAGSFTYFMFKWFFGNFGSDRRALMALTSRIRTLTTAIGAESRKTSSKENFLPWIQKISNMSCGSLQFRTLNWHYALDVTDVKLTTSSLHLHHPILFSEHVWQNVGGFLFLYREIQVRYSASFLVELSVSSPRKIFIFVI